MKQSIVKKKTTQDSSSKQDFKRKTPYYVSIITNSTGRYKSNWFSTLATLHNIKVKDQPSTSSSSSSQIASILPLRGWEASCYDVSINASINWTDPRICFFCKLKEDDLIDSSGLYFDHSKLKTNKTSLNCVEEVKDSEDKELQLSSANSNNQSSSFLDQMTTCIESSETFSGGGGGEEKRNAIDLEEAAVVEDLHTAATAVMVEDKKPNPEAVIDSSDKGSLGLPNSTRKRERSLISRSGEFTVEIQPRKKNRVYSTKQTKEEKARDEKLISAETVYGRLIPLPDGNYAHVNCVRWRPGVVERRGTIVNTFSLKKNIYQSRPCAVCHQRRYKSIFITISPSNITHKTHLNVLQGPYYLCPSNLPKILSFRVCFKRRVHVLRVPAFNRLA